MDRRAVDALRLGDGKVLRCRHDGVFAECAEWAWPLRRCCRLGRNWPLVAGPAADPGEDYVARQVEVGRRPAVVQRHLRYAAEVPADAHIPCQEAAGVEVGQRSGDVLELAVRQEEQDVVGRPVLRDANDLFRLDLVCHGLDLEADVPVLVAAHCGDQLVLVGGHQGGQDGPDDDND